jgi:hypothetical protein
VHDGRGPHLSFPRKWGALEPSSGIQLVPDFNRVERTGDADDSVFRLEARDDGRSGCLGNQAAESRRSWRR